MSASSQTVDEIQSVANSALSHSVQLLKEWLPDGELKGNEFWALNPTRPDSKRGSFSINVNFGKWCDLATMDKGGDLVALQAYLLCCAQKEAAADIAKTLGITGLGILGDYEPMDMERRRQRDEQAAKDRAERAAAELVEIAKRHAEAAMQAREIHFSGSPTLAGHPYFERKGSLNFGSSIRRGPFEQRGWEDALLVPIYGADQKIMSLEAISPTGEKIALKGGAKKGGIYPLASFTKHESGVVIVAEGVATAAACMRATGYPAVAAFSAGNLRTAAELVLKARPDVKIVIAADVGAELAACEAAASVNGFVAVPVGLSKKGDFWDVWHQHGDAAVAAAFESALHSEPAAVAAVAVALTAAMADVAPAAAAEQPAFEEVEPNDVRLSVADLRVQIDQLPAVVEDGEPIYDDRDPMPIARDMVHRLWSHEGSRAIQHHHGEFVKWDGGAYAECADHDVRAVTWLHLEKAQRWVKAAKKDGNELVLGQFKPNRQKVTDVVDAVRAVANVPGAISAPSWLAGSDLRPAADQILPCANGLFHLPTGDLLQHTPEFFGFNCLPFDLDQNAPAPTEWLKFLDSIWADDQESVDTLQKMMGYLLTGATNLQKIFLLIGPPRCGKGTILRVIEQLLGRANICAPDLNSIHDRFALEGFIGKQAALVGDARISPKADQSAIASRLLSISGEDALGIDRKNRPYWFGKLNTRFVICSNLVPTLSDASGALASRFVIMTMRHGFLGNEDLGLGDRLTAEMPGILKWAIEGWHKLQATGRIETPKAALEYAQELDDLASPIRKFLREVCVQGPGRWVDSKVLYTTWREWCDDNGRVHPGTETAFGRDLRGALHSINRKQYRVKTGRFWKYEGLDISDSLPPI